MEQRTTNYNNLRFLWDTRYTPITDEVVELLFLLRKECGGTWREVSRITNVKLRQIRRIRKREHKAVSFRMMDQMFCRSRHLYRLLDLEWLTIEELLERKIWAPQFAKELHEVLLPQGMSVGRAEEHDDGVRVLDADNVDPRQRPD